MFLNILFYSLYLTETQRNDYDIKNNYRIKQTAIEERFLTHNKHCEGACGYRHAPSQLCFVDALLSPPFRLPYGTFAEVLDG